MTWPPVAPASRPGRHSAVGVGPPPLLLPAAPLPRAGRPSPRGSRLLPAASGRGVDQLEQEPTLGVEAQLPREVADLLGQLQVEGPTPEAPGALSSGLTSKSKENWESRRRRRWGPNGVWGGGRWQRWTPVNDAVRLRRGGQEGKRGGVEREVSGKMLSATLRPLPSSPSSRRKCRRRRGPALRYWRRAAAGGTTTCLLPDPKKGPFLGREGLSPSAGDTKACHLSEGGEGSTPLNSTGPQTNVDEGLIRIDLPHCEKQSGS